MKNLAGRGAALVVMALLAACAFSADRAEDWTNYVRIGGYPMQTANIDRTLEAVKASHVFGIEIDNDITGRYESFVDPAEKLKEIQAFAGKAHTAGNRAFVYIAGLECITSGADKKEHSFFKDHPDWVQRNKEGKPAMFGGGAAFWVRGGDEDVWITPYAAEWRKLFMERVRQIAATGIDGIYIDIPYWMAIYNGWGDSWASFDDATVAAFKAKTGLDARKDVKVGDFSDPAFLRWIDFRTDTLTEFLKEIDQNIKRVNPKCLSIAEIYPGFESEATQVGTDVYQLYTVVDAIAHEYEFDNTDPDSVSPMAAARTQLDWVHYMAGMYTFRSFAAGRATWILNYSWENQKNVDRKDAMKNLFMSQVMAGANPWDTRGHGMSSSNDLPTRTEIYGWIAAHEKTFYRPRSPIHPIGVYFSPRTRDYFQRESVDAYLGSMAMLLEGHLEFQVVTPRTLAAFRGEALILPDARCLSDAEVKALTAYFSSGKPLIVSGETGKYDELRQPRKQNPIHKLLGVTGTEYKEAKGKYIFDPQSPGRSYTQLLKEDLDEFAVGGDYRTARFNISRERYLAQLEGVLKTQPSPKIEASPFVTAQIARVDGKLHIFLANFKGLKSKEVAVPTPETNVKISLPAGFHGRAYALPFLGETTELKPQKEAGGMIVRLPDIQRGMAVWFEE